MGLQKTQPRPWTTVEDRRLREAYAAGVRTRDIARELGRSSSSVRGRATAVGLRRPKLDTRDRIMASVRIDDESHCWIWTGYVCPLGYPRMYVDVSRKAEHPRNWLLVADGRWKVSTKFCRQSCGDRACIAPHHAVQMTGSQYLRWQHKSGFLGTAKHYAKQTRARRSRSALNDEIVRDVRRRFADGATRDELMAGWPAGRKALNDVLSHRTWRDAVAAAASVFAWRPGA